MKSTTTPIQGLSAKLQARNEQLAEETGKELEKLTKRFRTQLESELNSIKNDTLQSLKSLQEQHKTMVKISTWTWLKYLLIGLPVVILLLTILGAMVWRLSVMAQDRITTLAKYNETSADLKGVGMTLLEQNGNLYLILPKGEDKPKVFQDTNENYPGQWIVQLEE